jgi:hypothetical protein
MFRKLLQFIETTTEKTATILIYRMISVERNCQKFEYYLHRH